MMNDRENEGRRAILVGGGLGAIAAMIPWASVSAAPGGRLYVVAELEAKPEQAAALRTALTAFAKGAPKEAGCLGYQLLEDTTRAGRFFTYEMWQDEASLAAHLASPAMKAAGPTLAQILDKPFALARLRRLV